MEVIDPTTGQSLPPDSIQRVLHTSPSVLIYNIPPLSSSKGYIAASWTADKKRHIFTARLRIIETAVAISSAPLDEKLRVDIILEDPNSGQLFAAAPYFQPEVVLQALDSSRFFAVRVQGEGGRKAVLGIGFEERTEAFDFSVALQGVRKTLAFGETNKLSGQSKEPEEKKEDRQDFRLKEGEMVVVDLGNRNRRKLDPTKKGNECSSLSPATDGLLPPPPSAGDVKKMNRSNVKTQQPDLTAQSAEEMGFDNGEFGEFQ
ncbi:NADH pyrophosphatase [Blumeria hordei DH14]|uniref:NADH pyrophosphatase n=1 Tax=Blumeria graminis f. sp. hordei (strain DH14) TaxID=546991 RepID=N1J6Q3_BLUG1|nr:NADH pyrophosphatase [Blumeria hordei DH14]